MTSRKIRNKYTVVESKRSLLTHNLDERREDIESLVVRRVHLKQDLDTIDGRNQRLGHRARQTARDKGTRVKMRMPWLLVLLLLSRHVYLSVESFLSSSSGNHNTCLRLSVSSPSPHLSLSPHLQYFTLCLILLCAISMLY